MGEARNCKCSFAVQFQISVVKVYQIANIKELLYYLGVLALNALKTINMLIQTAILG